MENSGLVFFTSKVLWSILITSVWECLARLVCNIFQRDQRQNAVGDRKIMQEGTEADKLTGFVCPPQQGLMF